MPASLPGSCFPQNRVVFFFISASPQLGWPHKDGQMDTWRPWCGGGMLGGSCRDLWVYGMLCAVCRVQPGLCISPQLPAEPRACGVPQFPRSQRSSAALQSCWAWLSRPGIPGLGCCARSYSPPHCWRERGWAVCAPIPPHPRKKGLGVKGGDPRLHPWGVSSPDTPNPEWGTHPNPKPQSPNPPGLSVSQLRGFQTSRWRCAITRWELGRDTRLRSWNTGNAHREHNPGDCCSDSPHRGCWDGLRAAEHSQEQGKGKWDPWQGR